MPLRSLGRNAALLSLSIAALVAARASLQAQTPASSVETVELKTSDHVTVYADLLGAGGAAGKPLVLLFHQGGGDARGEYREIIPRLLENGYVVLAADTRGGGNRFGNVNRTVEARRDTSGTYCDAYRDMEAVLSYAVRRGLGRPRIVWGSSFSAALVMKLAAEHVEEIDGVLAFSPASGSPMTGCQPEQYVARLRAPLLVLRPREELSVTWIADQLEQFRRGGAQVYIAENGVHGSSMLVPARVRGETEAHWRVVIEFLRMAVRGRLLEALPLAPRETVIFGHQLPLTSARGRNGPEPSLPHPSVSEASAQVIAYRQFFMATHPMMGLAIHRD